MSAPATEQLAYRGVEPVNRLTDAGRQVAKGVALATFLLTVLSVLTLFNGYRYWLFAFGPARSAPWLMGLASLMPWCVAFTGLALIGASIGLLGRGQVFRKMFVVCLAVFLLVRVTHAVVDVSVTTNQMGNFGAPAVQQMTMFAAEVAGGMLEVPLLALALMLITRNWVREALLHDAAVASSMGLRFAALLSIGLGLVGLLHHGVALVNGGIRVRWAFRSYDLPLGGGVYGFNDTWNYVATVALAVCSLVAFVAGLWLLQPRRSAVRAILMQARVATIISVVNLAFGVWLIGIYASAGLGETVAPMVVMRLASLCCNLMLWTYLGSVDVTRFLASKTDIPLAVVAKEPHAVAG